jgi:hypothetical protein
VQLKGLDRLIKLIHFIGSQTRDLPVCSLVPTLVLVPIFENRDFAETVEKQKDAVRIALRFSY